RPAHLAQDDSRIEGALQHALKFCEDEEEERYDYICMLLNTHPLRTSEDIDGCIHAVQLDPEATAIKTGYWIEHPYELSVKVGCGVMGVLYSGYYQRQGIDRNVFLGNGAVVVTARKCLMEDNSIWGTKCKLYSMPVWRSIDIDSEEDLEYAERLVSHELHTV
ncbi:MAG: hypothetical protein ACXAEN_22105, partial [Candidatus Thorarchaeota archaeon]